MSEYHYEAIGEDGKKQLITLYVKGEVYNADNTCARFLGKGAAALSAYHNENRPKKVGRPRKSVETPAAD